MIFNVILWACITVFVGVVGYIVEMNKGKNIYSNIVAAFIAIFFTSPLIYFFIWPMSDVTINPVAALVGMGAGFVAVRVEDYIFLRV